MTYETKTKSGTLKYLRDRVQRALILDALVYTVEDWVANSSDCCSEIKLQFSSYRNLIVRSSSISEDQFNDSLAGKFESIMNVRPDNVKEAIETVFSSYGNTISSGDEVLIQPMLQDVEMSGVLFTRDPSSGAPYYIINYDLKGNTAAVTSGKFTGHTCIIAHSCENHNNMKFNRLIQLAKEVGKILDNESLDIEFAFDSKGELYLFQARPLSIKKNDTVLEQKKIITKIKEKLKSINADHPYLSGKYTILGIMPDWNPAEIIGIRPKPLALSLYKELITDSIWAYQRDNYGYKNLRSFPLLIDLMGIPYIDVRVSFNSFIPKTLDPLLANKLVNYYLDKLNNNQFLHDKIEFEIVFSCYTFDLLDRINILKSHDFNDEEISSIVHSLRNLTNNIVDNNSGLWLKDIERVDELKKRQELILSNNDFDDLTKIYWLIEDCKRYGTLPFAGLARAGFIAVQLLNSMVAVGILTINDKMVFLNSLDSVSTSMERDFRSLSRELFLNKYGHLRPGTYDILSPRYDDAPDLYFNWYKINDNNSYKEEFKLGLSQMRKIEQMLKEHRLDHDVVSLFSFIKAAVEGREYSKFVFTKTLSDILSLMKNFSKKNEIETDDMAYIDIQKFLKMYTTSWDINDELALLINSGRNKYEITKQLNLPPLIIKPEDIEIFHLPDNKPNFITQKSITAQVVTDLSNPDSIQDSIVFIPSADPGFDWIFTHGIAGFVTAYGGTNSHMAIRANELGLPAVIGAGEKLFNHWKKAQKIHVDCCNERVEVVL